MAKAFNLGEIRARFFYHMSDQANLVTYEVTRKLVLTGTIYFQAPADITPQALEAALRDEGELYDMFDTNCGRSEMEPLPHNLGEEFEVSPVPSGMDIPPNSTVFKLSDSDYCNALAEETAEYEGSGDDIEDGATESILDLIAPPTPETSTGTEPSNGPGVLASRPDEQN